MMRPLLLLASVLVLLSAFGPSDADTLDADAPPECQVEIDGNVLGASCDPQVIEVTKQPEHKVRVAKVAMVYALENSRVNSEERISMVSMTGSDDWNFVDVDNLYISVDDRDFSGYHDSSILSLGDAENVEKHYYYETNYVDLTGEQAVKVAEANKVEIQMGDAHFNVTVASKQMEELAKGIGPYVTGD